MTTNTGAVPALNGDPVSGVGMPVVELIEYPETFPEPILATYRNLPEESTVTEIGFVPAVKAGPGTAVRAPLAGGGFKNERIRGARAGYDNKSTERANPREEGGISNTREGTG